MSCIWQKHRDTITGVVHIYLCLTFVPCRWVPASHRTPDATPLHSSVAGAKLQASSSSTDHSKRIKNNRAASSPSCFPLPSPPLPLLCPPTGGVCVVAGPELGGQRSHRPRGCAAVRVPATQRQLVRACPGRKPGHRSRRGETHHRGAGDEERDARGKKRSAAYVLRCTVSFACIPAACRCTECWRSRPRLRWMYTVAGGCTECER